MAPIWDKRVLSGQLAGAKIVLVLRLNGSSTSGFEGLLSGLDRLQKSSLDECDELFKSGIEVEAGYPMAAVGVFGSTYHVVPASPISVEVISKGRSIPRILWIVDDVFD